MRNIFFLIAFDYFFFKRTQRRISIIGFRTLCPFADLCFVPAFELRVNFGLMPTFEAYRGAGRMLSE